MSSVDIPSADAGVTTEAPAAAPRARSAFRVDIEGLRGIAVLVVVLFHADWRWFSGGYIGVDVFFVISGFLITGLLLAENRATGRIALAAFWARRARRLIPALFVVLLATLAMTLFVYSPLAWGTIADQTQSAALFVSNLVFARDSQSYFAGAVTQSPLLHTWSLGVEEQFYLVWPLLVVGVIFVASRIRVGTRRVLGVTLVGLFGVSFLLSLVLTNRESPWAFYSSPTRAWEFATGGLLALAVPRLARWSGMSRSLASWIGLGALAFAVFSFDEFTPFPGTAALVPVMGTALILAAGRAGETSGASHVLVVPPLRALGRWSYSWYLWHWPLIVFAVVLWPDISPAGRTVAALVSLLLAVATYHFVENPFRTARVLQPPRNALVVGLCALLVVVACCAIVSRDANARVRDDDYLARLLRARDDRVEEVSKDCSPAVLPGVGDWCVFGNPDAARTVVLLGDSHAIQWEPALRTAAKQLDVRLIERAFAACPAINVLIAKPGTREPSNQCLAYRDATVEMLQGVHPDLVVISQADYFGRVIDSSGSVLDDDQTVTEWARATQELTKFVESLGAKVMVIQDNPQFETDPVECLARHRSTSRCSPKVSDVLPAFERFTKPEERAYRKAGVTDFVATRPLICNGERCLVQAGSMPVYSDKDHLSLEFVNKHTPLITDALQRALAGATPSAP